MCAPTVNYSDKIMAQQMKCWLLNAASFIGATANVHQQNPFMTSGIIFVPL